MSSRKTFPRHANSDISYTKGLDEKNDPNTPLYSDVDSTDVILHSAPKAPSQTIKHNNSTPMINPTTNDESVEYILQLAQKCICGSYILASDEISTIDNKFSPYHNWMCHKECLPLK